MPELLFIRTMKKMLVVVIVFTSQVVIAQNAQVVQAKFCNALYKVFELGIKDNFDAYDGTFVKQSPMMPVPVYGIQLEKFPVNYADKDNRFVAKTNLNLDSLSAEQTFGEMKTFTGRCLDTINWQKWTEQWGDEPSTVFMKEFKAAKAFSKELELTLAIVSIAPKLYTVNLYVKRR